MDVNAGATLAMNIAVPLAPNASRTTARQNGDPAIK
jgi:hypothetical protein